MARIGIKPPRFTSSYTIIYNPQILRLKESATFYNRLSGVGKDTIRGFRIYRWVYNRLKQAEEQAWSIMVETIEHLKLIQGVINRMAQVSFILKGWTVTIAIAGLGLAINIPNSWLGLLVLFPALVFWGLDAYYLRQERLFRCLYNKVCLDQDGVKIPFFSMDTAICEKEVGSWFKTLWRPTVLWFYLVVVIIVLLISLLSLLI